MKKSKLDMLDFDICMLNKKELKHIVGGAVRLGVTTSAIIIPPQGDPGDTEDPTLPPPPPPYAPIFDPNPGNDQIP
jgi:bacteriocin-like protein